MRVNASEDRPVQQGEAAFAGGVTAEIGADGQLLVTRAGEILLRGSAPTCVGWRGDETRAASVDIRSHADAVVIEAVAPGCDQIELSIDLASGRHWYGMGELLQQRWPLEEVALQRSPFLTWDNGISGVANVLEPVWFAATGVALWVAPGDPDVSTVSLNQPPDGATVPTWEPALSVHAPADERPFAVDAVGGDGLLTLRFVGDRLRVTLLVGGNVRDAHRGFVARAGKPASPPPTGSLTLPIWTTWARFKEAIDEEACLRFADEIQAAGFPIGTLEIDDKWQVEYGELAFDRQRFPDPRRMIDDIHSRGIQVNAWIVPFIDPKATVAQEAVAEGYVVRRPSGEPHIVTWWHDPAHLIDISDPRAEAWFADRLERLQRETGLDGFKFDAGEACYLPADAVTTGDLAPNDYSHKYAEFVSRRFPGSDVRTAWRNQRGTFLLREWDKHSEWGLGNGLQSVLTQALTFGLIGYPFVLPDMIGGNEYGGQHADDELLVRWAQVNALLPQMQFSVAPWERGQDVTRLTRDAAELHIGFAPEIERLAEEAVATGAPIVRPLLYEFPDDRQTETIWDEFMLGDRWLVAPAVEPAARARDVYLPSGRWRDDTGVVRDGGRWVRDVAAPLDRLPYFERLGLAG
jgi:alpha-glucosidase (family GH31 glycosyl hydrolase)